MRFNQRLSLVLATLAVCTPFAHTNSSLKHPSHTIIEAPQTSRHSFLDSTDALNTPRHVPRHSSLDSRHALQAPKRTVHTPTEPKPSPILTPKDVQSSTLEPQASRRQLQFSDTERPHPTWVGERGSLPRPTKPVYHSPPINAFSLGSLGHLKPYSNRPKAITAKPIKLLTPSYAKEVSLNSLSPTSASDKHQHVIGQSDRGSGRQLYSSSFTYEPASSSPSLGHQLSGLRYGQVSNSPSLGHQLSGSNYGQVSSSPNLGHQLSGSRYGQELASSSPSLEHQLSGSNYGQVSSPPNLGHQLSGSRYGQEPAGAANFIRHTEDHSHGGDAHYEFSYDVINSGGPKHEGQFFGHSESRHGHVTRGRYHVLLPDGRHQKVAYMADLGGYRAHVSYT